VVVVPVGRRRLRGAGSGRLTPAAGLGLGIGVLWLSLIVGLPIAAIVARSLGGGPGTFWSEVTSDEALDTLRLTVGAALGATAVNAVIGTLIAWVLVRDTFPGKRLLEVLIDIPFALPTIVAGLVLISLYGPRSPFGIDLVGTRRGVFLALLFVTLPFVVRSVQPVLIDMERDVEEAAASLGANAWQRFTRIILPTIRWALAYGVVLSLARSLGEFGAVRVVSGSVTGESQTLTLFVNDNYQEFGPGPEQAAFTAASTLMLVAVLFIVLIAWLRPKEKS